MHELTVFQKLPNPFGWIQFRAVCRERDERHVSRHDEVVGLSVEARAIDNDGGVVRRQNRLRDDGEMRVHRRRAHLLNDESGADVPFGAEGAEQPD